MPKLVVLVVAQEELKDEDIIRYHSKGVDTGNRLRLPGKGSAGINGGPNGDLYIEFTVGRTRVI